MLSCWHPQPDDRPSFGSLIKKVEKLLEATQPYIDLSMAVSDDYFRHDSNEVGNNPRDSVYESTSRTSTPRPSTSRVT